MRREKSFTGRIIKNNWYAMKEAMSIAPKRVWVACGKHRPVGMRNSDR